MSNKRMRQGDIYFDETIRQFLLYGVAARGTPGWRLRTSRFFDDGDEIRSTWQRHKADLMKEWPGPGLPWVEKYLKDEHGAFQGIYEKGFL